MRLRPVWYAEPVHELPEDQTAAAAEPGRQRVDRLLAETSRVEAFSDVRIPFTEIVLVRRPAEPAPAGEARPGA